MLFAFPLRTHSCTALPLQSIVQVVFYIALLRFSVNDNAWRLRESPHRKAQDYMYGLLAIQQRKSLRERS